MASECAGCARARKEQAERFPSFFGPTYGGASEPSELLSGPIEKKLDRAAFANQVRNSNARRLELLADSQQAYAQPEDALSNFRFISEALTRSGLPTSLAQVCLVFFYKHLAGIISHVANPAFADREPVDGRFDDAVNYLEFLRAILVEDSQSQHPADESAVR